MDITSEIRDGGDTRPKFRAVEEELADRLQAVGRAAIAEVLAEYEPGSELVDIGGRVYRRMAEATTGRYGSLWGTVEVSRHLYREHGVHNGPTVVPLELDAGMAFGRWTPMAAEAVAHLHQALPAREAAQTCERLKVLGSSRSTLLRAGEMIGAHWHARRDEGESQLVREMELDGDVRALSVSVDRVNIPMAEPSKDADRRLEVVYRQAFCAVLTLHDASGEALDSIRYGQMPSFGRDAIERAVARDVDVLLSRQPCLKLVGVADGAPEMQGFLRRVLGKHQPAAVVVDYWHLIEKLSAAISATGRKVPDYLPRWQRDLLDHDDAITTIDRTLREWMCAYHEDDVPDALYEAFTYLDNQADSMRYASLRARGLPIGSGRVEATCKTVVAVRMKRAGSRWKPQGAQACLQLRALACSSPERWTAAMKVMGDTFRQPMLPVRCAA